MPDVELAPASDRSIDPFPVAKMPSGLHSFFHVLHPLHQSIGDLFWTRWITLRPPQVFPNHDLDMALLGKTELTKLLFCEALLIVF